MLETKITDSVTCCITAFSAAKKAMMMFVSRRTLPGIRIDLFAALLDGTRHGVEVRGGNAAAEVQDVLTGRSARFGQVAREVQDLALVRSVQAIHLLDDFVFDSLCHDEFNLSKGTLNVKRAGITLRFCQRVNSCSGINCYRMDCGSTCLTPGATNHTADQGFFIL